MTSQRPAVSFDEIIQAGRAQKKNQELANQIFSKNRPPTAPSRDTARKSSQPPSLASRVGVAKRSSSSTNVKTQKSNPFNPPSRPSSAAAQTARTYRIATAVTDTHQTNVVPTQPRASLPGPGLSIRGTAGPFVVEASNFAPGTTAADIESALQSVVSDHNNPTTCRIITTEPKVTAEMVFTEKTVADTVIATFNNQKADGRILKVFMSHSGPEAAAYLEETNIQTISTPAKELFTDNTAPMEDVDMDSESIPAAYDDAREVADRDRRERESSRAKPDIQADRPAFMDRSKSDRNPSDTTPSQPREDRRRDEGRDRDRERDRDYHDRDRDRDRDRSDRDRDHRYNEQPRYDRRPDDVRPSYPAPRDTFSSSRGATRPYGNGLGGSGLGRGGFQGGNRMYSDDTTRGGGRGGGGYRGGFRGYR